LHVYIGVNPAPSTVCKQALAIYRISKDLQIRFNGWMRDIDACLYVRASDRTTLERLVADGKTPQNEGSPGNLAADGGGQ
jgi:hypothetical protein